jgi:hypothetical protein
MAYIFFATRRAGSVRTPWYCRARPVPALITCSGFEDLSIARGTPCCPDTLIFGCCQKMTATASFHPSVCAEQNAHGAFRYGTEVSSDERRQVPLIVDGRPISSKERSLLSSSWEGRHSNGSKFLEACPAEPPAGLLGNQELPSSRMQRNGDKVYR